MIGDIDFYMNHISLSISHIFFKHFQQYFFRFGIFLYSISISAIKIDFDELVHSATIVHVSRLIMSTGTAYSFFKCRVQSEKKSTVLKRVSKYNLR